MKLKLSFLLLFVLSSFFMQSQQFGFRFGYNLADQLIEAPDAPGFTFNTEENRKAQSAFHIGPTFEFPVSDNVFINTGVIFNLKGYRYTYEYFADTDTVNDAVDRLVYMYLDIPLQATYKHVINEDVKVFGTIGPSVGVSLGAQFIYEEPDGDNDNHFYPVVSDLIDLPEDNYWGVLPIEFSLGVSAGVQRKNLQIGVGYLHGLSNIAPPTDGVESDVKVYNRTFQVSFNILIGDKEMRAAEN